MKSLILLCSALLLTTPVHAAQLTLELGAGSRTWQTDELLKHPLARTVTVKDDVSYKRDMSYRAVPISALLTGVKADDHLQAVALDGFAAELPAAPLLTQEGAQAWLAIEDPAKPWPPLAEGKHSAGPFYLVWTNPRPVISAPSNGRSKWPASSAWRRWRNVSQPCAQTPSWRPATR